MHETARVYQYECQLFLRCAPGQLLLWFLMNSLLVHVGVLRSNASSSRKLAIFRFRAWCTASLLTGPVTRQHPGLNQIIYVILPVGLTFGEGHSPQTAWRDNSSIATPTRQARIENGLRFRNVAPKTPSDILDGHQK